MGISMTPLPWHLEAAKEIELEFTKKRDVPWKVGIREDITDLIAARDPGMAIIERAGAELTTAFLDRERALRSQVEALRKESALLRQIESANAKLFLSYVEERKALREALEKYGAHMDFCASRHRFEGRCNCGLAEALSATKEATDGKA